MTQRERRSFSLRFIEINRFKLKVIAETRVLVSNGRVSGNSAVVPGVAGVHKVRNSFDDGGSS